MVNQDTPRTTDPLDLHGLLEGYAAVQPRRAAGGLHALAGFDYQLRLYVACLAEGLAAGSDALGEAGRVFTEALSDLARQEGDTLVCIQAKRTLTRAALKDAAGEIVAIDDFLGHHAPSHRERVRFELIASRGDAGLTWADLPATAPENPLITRLAQQGRLLPPRLESDPWWRTIAAVWDRLEDPYDFARFALERALGRGLTPEDAARVRDDLCERFTRSRHPARPMGQPLRPRDFDPVANPSPRLEVGLEITLPRLRDAQYMPRERRRDALHATLEERFELSRRDLQAGVRVFWISGRSGVGKSVLLVQLLERLVREGRRVLWLGGAAEKLEPALRALAEQPEGEPLPEFIAVDDLYDRDARGRIDLAGLGRLIEEAGHRPWPLVITCGPAEFAEAFQEATRFNGFELHRETVNPLAADESLRLADWYRGRTGREPAAGPAFAQAREGDEGLFISLAMELEHGDLRGFALRFAERIAANGLEPALRLPLALNRLYLRAPYEWLGEEDRERLGSLNQEGDFNLLDPGASGQVVRLTHPHLADALYRASRKPGNPTAYANDLVKAFRRALEERRLALVEQLLALFSAPREGLAGERLAAVEDALLAEGCAKAWQAEAPGLELEPDTAASIAASWASWAVGQPAVSRVLGNGLLALAVDRLDAALKVWPYTWRRLVEVGPAYIYLLGWQWLSDHEEHAEWPYVWLTLVAAPQSQLPPGVTPDDLYTLGWQWLPGREERAEWAHVWRELVAISSSQLPSGVTPDDLYTLGWQWLPGREERAEWAHVWWELVAVPNSQLPPGVSPTNLYALGWQWLPGREERPEWSFIWQALWAASRQDDAILSRPGLLQRVQKWLLTPANRERGEWDKLFESALDGGLREETFLRAGANWLERHYDKYQAPLLIKKVLDASPHDAPWLDTHVSRLAEWLGEHAVKWPAEAIMSRLAKAPPQALDTAGNDTLLGWNQLHHQLRQRIERRQRFIAEHPKGEQLEGEIISQNRGGYLVKVADVFAFLPNSQARPLHRMPVKELPDTKHEFEIIKLDQEKLDIFLALRDKSLDSALIQLTEGQLIDGIIANIVKYGLFIDVGGINGLLHHTNLLDPSPGDLHQRFTIGAPLRVRIGSIDRAKGRIELFQEPPPEE